MSKEHDTAPALPGGSIDMNELHRAIKQGSGPEKALERAVIEVASETGGEAFGDAVPADESDAPPDREPAPAPTADSK